MIEPEEIIKLNQDWISIFFLLSLLILGVLKIIDKKKFGLLVYSINSEKYYSVYAKEKKTNYFNLFYITFIGFLAFFFYKRKKLENLLILIIKKVFPNNKLGLNTTK